MTDYRSLMMNFSKAELIKFAGDNLIENLIEWNPDNESLLTSKKLISMINAIHGYKIFKNKEFRKKLLLSMTEKDIIDIKKHCLGVGMQNEKDVYKIIEEVVKKPWGNNSCSKQLLRAWDVDATILDSSNNNTEGVKEVVNVLSNEQFYELLDYQYYIKQRVLNEICSDIQLNRLFVQMPTGTGKTKTAMHTLCSYYQFKLKNRGVIIWIAHTNELLEQAYTTFCSVWTHVGNRPINTYKLCGNTTIEDKEIDGIVFCGLSKLISIYNSDKELFEKLHKACRLIVFDEAHKAAADITRKVIEELMRMPNDYPNRHLLGLSATPGRTTDRSYDNNLLTNMFGNKLISVDIDIINHINCGRIEASNALKNNNIIRYFQDRGILSKMVVKRLEYKNNFTTKELNVISSFIEKMGFDNNDFTDKELKIFASNKERNKKIMEILRDLANNKIPTIVFACSVNHAKMLSAMLTVEGIENGLVIGDMSIAERKNTISNFKNPENPVKILINYEVLTTGFDSTNIKCVFITRPTNSIVLYSQMLGRGLRGPAMGGNEKCLLIDIDDNLSVYNHEMAFEHFDDYWYARSVL